MAEQTTPATGWSSCQLSEHIEEVRLRQAQVTSLLPWLIADPGLLDALELMSAAVTERIEHQDGMHYDDVLVQIVEN